MLPRSLLPLLLAVPCAVACVKAKKEETPAGPVSGGFVSVADFTSPKLAPLDGARLADTVDRKRLFFATDPDASTASGDDTDTCFRRSNKRHIMKATAGKITVAYDEDLTACYKEDQSKLAKPDPFDIVEVRSRLLLEFGCAGADLSKFDGKSLFDLAEEGSTEDPCLAAGGSESSFFVNASGLYKSKAKAGENARYTIHVETKSATMTAAGGACGKRRSGKTTTVAACRDLSLSRELQADAAGDQLDDAESTGLVFDTGDRFFQAGKWTIRSLQGWTGELVYTGAATPPTWSLTKGGETKTGTFTGGAAVGLRDQGAVELRLRRIFGWP